MQTKLIAILLGVAGLAVAQTPPPAAQPPAAAPPQISAPSSSAPPGPPAPMGPLSLTDASLSQVVDQLARFLHLNLMVDTKLQGSVTINTYGDTRSLDARELLNQILRINGFGLVQEGNIYRVVQLNEINHEPLRPQQLAGADIPDDDQTMLNLVFLKYVSVDELMKVLEVFTGDHAQIKSYAPSNLLFILDSRRNMRRTMEIINLFDNDTFVNQRVRLFELKNTRPTDIQKDLENILKNIALDEKNPPAHFLAIDRISTLIAIASNPGVFETVAKWISKLDVPVKIAPGGAIETHVYRVRYRDSYCLAMALSELYGISTPVMSGGYGGYAGGMQPGYGGYGGYGGSGGGYGGYGGYGAVGGGYGGYGGGGAGYGIGSNYANPGGYGNMNGFSAGFGGAGTCGSGAMPGGGGYGAPAFGGYSAQVPYGVNPNGATGQTARTAAQGTNGTAPAAQAASDQPRPPRIVPNPLDNALIIQADAQQYQNILSILKELDTPPRQILLEAKIYEVDLTDQFSSGITYSLGSRTSTTIQTALNSGGTATLTAGALVQGGRELLAMLSLNENASKVHMISEPSLIATDSIPATITVGDQVPVATGTTVIPSSGGVVTSSGISSENTGITLDVNARVSPGGIVTLYIGQQISAIDNSVATVGGTPAFSQQVVQTQVTMQDGDTVAIGGTIKDTVTDQINGIPGLIHIPWVGPILFGSKQKQHTRSEMIMFMTPHVIWDETSLIEASDELKSRVQMLKKMVKNL